MSVAADARVVDPAALEESSGYPLAHCSATGEVRFRFERPDGFAQWVLTATLRAGAVLKWGVAHGDEAVYVVEGELAVGAGRACAGGAVIIESDTATELRAISHSRIVHVGSDSDALVEARPLGLPAARGRGVHLLEPTGIRALGTNATARSTVAYFANGKCPSCRIMLYRVQSEGDTRSHVHTQPQLQHVLSGTIGIGGFTVSKGMTFAVPAGYRYGYRAEGPWELLVYRPDLSMMRYKPQEDLVDEGGAFSEAPPWAS